ncbi:MAG: hypothetical protein KAU14_08270, partial [Thermoplasmata archaeon]|nr:hypothetical protein [Thermoplasmata archaeon]
SDHWVELKNTTLPKGWCASFWSEQDEEIRDGFWSVEGRSKKAFKVKIECPGDVTLGDRVTIEIRAYMGPDVEDSIVELDLVVGAFRGVSVGINAQTMLIDTAGDTAELEVTITNSGNARDTIRLGDNAPGGWKVTYDPGDSFDMDAGISQTVTVKVKSPSNGKRGEEIDLEIFAYSVGDPSKNESVTSGLRIIEEKDDDSPGFELTILIAGLLIPVVVWRKKRRE